jgi:hypothetical protein
MQRERFGHVLSRGREDLLERNICWLLELRQRYNHLESLGQHLELQLPLMFEAQLLQEYGLLLKKQLEYWEMRDLTREQTSPNLEPKDVVDRRHTTCISTKHIP